MKIGIIGAGQMGGTLARLLVQLGHEVAIANSRGPETLTELAAETGATAVSVDDAVKAADMVILAIPVKAALELPPLLLAGVPASVVVVDTGNYHPELRDGHIEAIDEGMPDSAWLALLIGCPVVKAFNTILATTLAKAGCPKGTPGRIALPVAGDSSKAKATVKHLIDALGFDSVDAGALSDSWRQQTGAPAYCKDLDEPALRLALAAAEHDRVGDYCAAREDELRRALAASGR